MGVTNSWNAKKASATTGIPMTAVKTYLLGANVRTRTTAANSTGNQLKGMRRLDNSTGMLAML